MNRKRNVLLPVVLLLMAAAPGQVAAQSTIRQPRAHTPYSVEVEPHVAFGAEAPGPGAGSGAGLGGRVSFVIAPEGFIPPINDSVAISFGADLLRYRGDGGWSGDCAHFEPGPNGTTICTDIDSYGGPASLVLLPVVMQWNFWFTRQWSAFGEPGLVIAAGRSSFDVTPALYFGGRLQLNDKLALTLRVGWPTLTFGISFLQ